MKVKNEKKKTLLHFLFGALRVNTLAKFFNNLHGDNIYICNTLAKFFNNLHGDYIYMLHVSKVFQ